MTVFFIPYEFVYKTISFYLRSLSVSLPAANVHYQSRDTFQPLHPHPYPYHHCHPQPTHRQKLINTSPLEVGVFFPWLLFLNLPSSLPSHEALPLLPLHLLLQLMYHIYMYSSCDVLLVLST